MSALDVGYHDYKGTLVSWHGLASEDYVMTSITVKENARDTGNTNTDDLRAGLTMEIDSTTGKYVQFASDHDSLVILAEDIYDLLDYGDTVAKAFLRATFKLNAVIESATVTWSSAQRFIIRQDYQA